MKVAVAYYSQHHGNTKKLLDAIAQTHEITLIDVTQTPSADLTEYDAIGFASGIYYSKFHKGVLTFAEQNLPRTKQVFFLYTYGTAKKGYTDAIAKVADCKGASILGEFGCPGFDTFGPFKLIGGIAKGRPNQDDLAGAVKFYDSIIG